MDELTTTQIETLRSVCNDLHDEELEEMAQDFINILLDLYQYHNGDICGETYHQSIWNFKKKWFETARDERLHKIIDEQIALVSRHLHAVVGPREVKTT